MQYFNQERQRWEMNTPEKGFFYFHPLILKNKDAKNPLQLSNIEKAKTIIIDIDIQPSSEYDKVSREVHSILTVRKEVYTGNNHYFLIEYDRFLNNQEYKEEVAKIQSILKSHKIPFDAQPMRQNAPSKDPERRHYKTNRIGSILFDDPQGIATITANKTVPTPAIKEPHDDEAESEQLPNDKYNALLSNCKVMQYWADNPDETSNDEWFNALKIINRFKESIPLANEFSRGYKQYQLKHVTEEAKRVRRSGYREPTCHTVSKINSTTSEICFTCPRYSSNGTPTACLTSEPTSYPENYFTRQFSLYVKNGDDVKRLYDWEMQPVGLIETDDGLIVVFDFKKENKKIKVPIPTICFASNPKRKELLAKYGIFQCNDSSKDDSYITNFFKMYTDLAIDKEMITKLKQYKSLGFQEDGNFNYGYFIVNEKGERQIVEYVSPMIEKHSRTVTPKTKSSIEDWVDAANVIYSSQAMHPVAILGNMLGSLLMGLADSGMKNAIFYYYQNGTGGGKSLAAKMAYSVFSNSKDYPINGATKAGLENKLSLLNSFPLYYDEFSITTQRPREVIEDFKMLANGVGKAKADGATGFNAELKTWSGNTIITSNTSMIKYLNDHAKNEEALFARVLELEVKDTLFANDFERSKEMKEAFAVLQENAGVVGYEFIKYIQANKDSVCKDIDIYYNELGKDFEISRTRFILMGIACSIISLKWLQQKGLKINLKTVMNYYKSSVKNQLKQRDFNEDKLLNLIDDIVETYQNQIVNTNTIPNNVFTNKFIKLAGAIEGNNLKLSYKCFKQYLSDNGYDEQKITKELLRAGLFLDRDGNVMSATVTDLKSRQRPFYKMTNCEQQMAQLICINLFYKNT